MFKQTLFTLSLIGAVFSASTTLVAQSYPKSRISVPFSVPISDLQAFAERALPQRLHSRNYGRTCAEPQRACTKVPEFRGFKVTMKNRCVEVSPRIDCTITENVAREGAMRVTARGAKLTVAQDIFATATVRGRGDIGRHIRQTVRARAEVKVSTTFGISSNWTPKVPAQLSYRWLQRPEFRLFNMFPISLGSTLGPPLDNALRDFERQLPGELAKIKLRDELTVLWDEIQKPHLLANIDGVQAYLHLRPSAIGLNGPSFHNNRLNARLDMSLRASVTNSPRGPVRTKLPNNRPQSAATTSIVVPVTVTTGSLNRLIAGQLPKTFDLRQQPTARATIHQASLRVEGGQLVADMLLDADIAGLAIKGQVLELRADMAFTAASQTLTFSDIDLSVPGAGWFKGLAQTALISLLELFLQDTVAVSLKKEVEKFQAPLNKALNRNIAPGLRLSGRGSVSIKDISVMARRNAIEAVLTSSGAVQITGFDPLGR